jgi:asparagine synthase (glutamine-hydrolysing)
MSGIAGIVRRDGAEIDRLETMAHAFSGALAHRGPDGAGAWRSPDRDVLLVQRRLAAIDLTRNAAQPMRSADGRHIIVFNGAIYNYRELRHDLERRSVSFTTASDTEVLLRLITLEGPRALARVRGMFALAVWDEEDGSLLLGRDRFGIKPLYVVVGSKQIAFASELGALRMAGLVGNKPAPAAVLAFLGWGTVPSPLAWNRDAEMLEAGTWVEWDQEGAERRGRFADARSPYRTRDQAPAEETEFSRAVGAAVRDSVRAHLVADVPVGVFLSGSVDSAAIVSAASSAGASTLSTFTIRFDDRRPESPAARSVADAFGTVHHDIHVSASQIASNVTDIVAHLDQPTIYAVNAYSIARAAAQAGLKSVLSGTGAEELFGGYPSFTRLPRAMQAKRMAGPGWSLVAAAGQKVLPDRLQERWRHFATTNGSMLEAYRVQRAFCLPSEIASLAGPALLDEIAWREAEESVAHVERTQLSPLGDERPAAAVARLELTQHLQSELLRDLDVTSMLNGLEVRVPFVDHHLIGTVWPELGQHPRLLAGKTLLHASLEAPLPRPVFEPPKQGFAVPISKWINEELASFVQDGLRSAAAAGWISRDAPVLVWDDWINGAVHWTRPWGLAVLGYFVSAAR